MTFDKVFLAFLNLHVFLFGVIPSCLPDHRAKSLDSSNSERHQHRFRHFSENPPKERKEVLFIEKISSPKFLFQESKEKELAPCQVGTEYRIGNSPGISGLQTFIERSRIVGRCITKMDSGCRSVKYPTNLRRIVKHYR
jgi:hypothetical protein